MTEESSNKIVTGAWSLLTTLKTKSLVFCLFVFLVDT